MELQNGEVIGERFKVLEYLGGGTFGEVYRAEDLNLQTEIALKILRAPARAVAADRQGFLEEARRQATLRDRQHVVPIYDAGEVPHQRGPLPFIAMRYLPGGSLADRLAARYWLGVEGACRIGAEIASALAAAAAKHIVHRDVKPLNILLDEDGHAWLADFGLAKAMANSASVNSRSAGTAAYMAPEQFKVGVPITARADVYALACTLFEMIAGERPFGGDPAQVMFGHVHLPAPRLASEAPSTPPELDVLVDRMLGKDPEGRPSAAEVRDALQRISARSPAAGTIQTNPVDGAEMVYVPAGPFRMGGSRQKDNPRRTVDLDAFWIYKTPVTVARYRKFCEVTGRQMPPAPGWGWNDDHPMAGVNWHDATAYGDWAGTALPTEAQWEKAARGTKGWTYPWGNDWDPEKLQCSKATMMDAGGTAPVGSHPAGASPYGCLDMAGNVFQWCADWYDENYMKNAPATNPTGPASGEGRVMRGCCWFLNEKINFRCANRFPINPDPPSAQSGAMYFFGFRCVVRAVG